VETIISCLKAVNYSRLATLNISYYCNIIYIIIIIYYNIMTCLSFLLNIILILNEHIIELNIIWNYHIHVPLMEKCQSMQRKPKNKLL